jgi:1-acyl-sn-glycerol-3-phosphate acyltransferase
MLTDERSLWWRIGTALTRPIAKALFQIRVRGTQNIPVGPGILAFNHVSVLDGPCLAIETSARGKREVRFLVAAEMFKIFFFGWVVKAFDQIPIRRGEGDEAALDEAIGSIRAGALAAIAPEGRVNENPAAGLQRIRSGVARMAIPTGAPVVPVGIWGTQTRWGRSGFDWSKLWRRRIVAIVYGETLSAGADETVEAFCERLRAALEATVERAKAAALP